MEEFIPEKYRTFAGAVFVLSTIALATYIPKETSYSSRVDRSISLFGYLVFLLGLWGSSRKRSAIKWRPVIVGILSQFVLATFVLRTRIGRQIFTFLAETFTTFLDFSNVGIDIPRGCPFV